ncbi:MAG: D-glycero-beta-D-manno-heptose 1,7-bisphosphate 7-phosphatase [Candidatus Nealsonbacteria bacterium]
MSIQPKIKTQKEIIGICRSFKKRKKTVVTCNGSFDILHAGHFQRLKEAKAQGDVLIVCLNSDQSVRAYKGPGRPINKQAVRVQNLVVLPYIDYLVVFNELNPKNILNKIKPDIHCVGRDWGKNCVERDVVEKNGGKIYVAKWLKGFSTSDIIKTPKIGAIFLDRDGVININEPEYVHRIEDFKFVPRALPALRRLSQTDYKIIIATNQSGIGREYYTEKDLEVLHQWMLRRFKKEGIRIDKIYYCPHAPGQKCNCRKPKTGMIEQAVKDFGINLSKSWIIGDSERDIQMGKEVNLKTILLGGEVKNLAEAVKIILQ